ncbi:hypothetical protein BKH41_00740 [Helicobacter sp. 12S02232-10]|uniref:hypothetical protein n=1 Tax=Helicobacter sp. 12S02232-10 TaxID=1476197 RepID=UPI000BA74128|nr:hypothetical protein [Helicobacter sp. 12S02232-10]PAF49862.1 hypothetical protein BKH41_00740 [Helicobacter sp. 12S02232-10]
MKKIEDKEIAEFVKMTQQGINKMKNKKPEKYQAVRTGCEIILNNVDMDLVKKYYEHLKIVKFDK